MFPEGSGGSGEDPGEGESEQENRGNLSHCSLFRYCLLTHLLIL